MPASNRRSHGPRRAHAAQRFDGQCGQRDLWDSGSRDATSMRPLFAHRRDERLDGAGEEATGERKRRSGEDRPGSPRVVGEVADARLAHYRGRVCTQRRSDLSCVPRGAGQFVRRRDPAERVSDAVDAGPHEVR